MINVQEWLDQKYPLENRNQITELNISKKNLEGSLNLTGFVNLEKIEFDFNKITNLDISECYNLKKISCLGNQLTNLNLTNLTQLESLWCFGNLLSRIDYPVSNCDKLVALGLNENNFPSQDLTVFSQFTNLMHLYIGNEEWERISQGIYNRFHGSLEPLRNLKRLMVLDIRNTDINSGVEYLPISAGLVEYSSRERRNSKVKEIAWQLDLRKSKTQSEWESLGFTLPEIKSWMEVGLKANEHDLANHLKNEKNLNPSEARSDLKSLRSEFENRFQDQIEIPAKRQKY